MEPVDDQRRLADSAAAVWPGRAEAMFGRSASYQLINPVLAAEWNWPIPAPTTSMGIRLRGIAVAADSSQSDSCFCFRVAMEEIE